MSRPTLDNYDSDNIAYRYDDIEPIARRGRKGLKQEELDRLLHAQQNERARDMYAPRY